MIIGSQSRIFISYGRGGNGLKWKASLLRALHVFEQHHLLDVWEDGRIRIGSDWDGDIQQAMSSARLAVLLLTKEALETEYILNTEFPFISERQELEQLPVVPVICEPSNWKDHDWLRATLAPNTGNPLSELSEAGQDSAFRKLATDIANELSRPAFSFLSLSAGERREAKTYLEKFPLTRSAGLREEKLIGRYQELALLDLAFVQPQTAIVSLVAWGGVGKTMLVQHWLQRLQREGWFGIRRIYAWSFSVLRLDLGNLTDEAGAALLHHAGTNRAGAAEIKSDDKELLAASREVDGHALTLNLLARFLARAYGGDIRLREFVKFEQADRAEQGGTTFKMLAAFENWFASSGEFGARQLAIMKILGLFDGPADSLCIEELRSPPIIRRLTDPLFTMTANSRTQRASRQPLPDEDWNTATSYLADFGLLSIESAGDEQLIDCHPLIREYFASSLQTKNANSWINAHDRLYKLLIDNSSMWRNMTVVQYLYRAVAHGCKAGFHNSVLEGIVQNRLMRVNDPDRFFTQTMFGAWESDLGALRNFFDKPWGQTVAKLSERQRTWLWAVAGLCLRSLGRTSEAIEPWTLALQSDIDSKAWLDASESATNLSELHLILGNIKRAIELADQGHIFADRSEQGPDSESRIVLAVSAYGAAEHQVGEYQKAAGAFKQAEYHLQGRPGPLINSVQGFHYCELLLSLPERDAWRRFLCLSSNHPDEDIRKACVAVLKRAGETIEYRKSRPLDLAVDHLSIGRASFYKSFPTTITLHIEEALKNFRASGSIVYVPLALLTRAWITALKGDMTGARGDLEEAWDIAERGPMRLQMADIHLHRARLFFREKTYPWKSPQDDLATAEQLINECGYHRRDEELADAKRAILNIEK